MSDNQKNNSEDNKKLIFSTEQSQSRDLLKEKGVDLSVEQSKYQKGDDSDSEILTNLITSNDDLESDDDSSEFLEEVSNFDEFKNDLSIQTDYSKKQESRRKFLKRLFLITVLIVASVLTYLHSQNKLTQILNGDEVSSSLKIQSLKNQYQSDLMYNLLQKSSVINQDLAYSALNYLEALQIQESLFQDRSKKLSAQKSELDLRIKIENNFDLLKENLSKTKNLNILDKSSVIQVIQSNSELQDESKSQLVEFLKYAPILEILSKDYKSFDKTEFTKLLMEYLDATKSIKLNNLAYSYSTKFNFNNLLVDLELTLKEYDSNFQIFKTSEVVDLSKLTFDSSTNKGTLAFNYTLSSNTPIKELIEIENKFAESEVFEITKSTTFKTPSVNEESEFDPVNISLSFNYKQS